MLREKFYSSESYRKGPIRILLLLSVILVAFSNEYSFNNPQALEETMYEHLGITETQFQLFYSLYSLPNVFTLIFVGFVVDIWGVRISLIILSFALMMCQLLFAIGGHIANYPLMLFARVLFGIASRSLFIPQASIISFWFKGRQLELALGAGITFPELGNALNSFLTPLIYEWTGSLGAPLFVSVLINLIGFFCAVTAASIDRTAQRVDFQSDVASEHSQLSLDAIQSSHEKIKCKDLSQLRNSFWIVSCLCMLTMTEYIPFLDNANRLFQKRFCFSQTSAGTAVSVTYVITAVFSIPLGIIVNYIGNRRFFIIAATVIFTIAHLIILLGEQCDTDQNVAAVWGLVFIGIGYTFYANCVVATIPLVVKKKVLGTAFGIMEIISSLAECVVPIFTGYLIESSQTSQAGFKKSSLFFVLVGVAGILTSLSLFFIDKMVKIKLDKGTRVKKSSPRIFEQQCQITTGYRKISVLTSDNKHNH